MKTYYSNNDDTYNDKSNYIKDNKNKNDKYNKNNNHNDYGKK